MSEKQFQYVILHKTCVWFYCSQFSNKFWTGEHCVFGEWWWWGGGVYSTTSVGLG